MNVSKSDDFELHPVSNEDPDRKKRSIPDNPSPERMLTSCCLTRGSAATGEERSDEPDIGWNDWLGV